ncbi:PilC/PilY family type IV pilus protein [Lysobacter sp. M15]|uniref:pilus assembly protein n=1 Tax=Lysobacter sp. M15 TaxID=2916837 RepID=UPI001F5900EC|nr:PilC/PilY family type IV pilus protein [Lysobacter sp. M15]
MQIRFPLLAAVATLAIGLGLGMPALHAGIAQQPLTLTPAVKPNIALIIDNSGSMDGELLFPTNDGALWWNTSTGNAGSRSFYGAGRSGAGFNYNDAGEANATWKKYTYLFPNGTGAGNRVYGDAENDHYAVPPLPEYAFARSADYNAAYYNPAVVYAPWRDGGGHTFADADPRSARSDPLAGAGTIDLAANLASNAGNWMFRVQDGMRTNAGSNARRAGGAVSLAFAYYPATYYSRSTASAAFRVGGRDYNCASPDPAAYTDYAANPTVALPGGVHAIAPDGACLVRTQIAAGSAEMRNFANWFQYHRKRHLALRAGMGSAFADIDSARIGMTPINGLVPSLTMWDIDSQRDDLYQAFYGVGGNGGGTPNRPALRFVGEQFDSNRSIVQQACQRNFALQFTDGFSNPDAGTGVGNTDGSSGSPYQDAYANTIADIAMRYYQRVRSDLPSGQVPVPASCSNASPPRHLDCNRNPHMNTYGITLGAQGNLFGNTHNRVADAYTDPPAWANPTAQRNPVQVDDLYHAAVNGRGEMLNARSTSELAATLQQALAGILSDSIGASSRTTASSTRASAGTQLFQARYDARQWTGELIAYDLLANGGVGSVQWNAANAIPAHAARRVYTRNPATGSLVEFRWDQLPAALQATLGTDPATGLPDALGERRVDWLRGSDADHEDRGGVLRERDIALGDIVNSSPRYVGADNYAYDRLPAGAPGRGTYQAYRFSKVGRPATVYVGANDGMLHAFDAATGIERWAYVPSEMIAGLNQLMRPDYRHRYYVDGQPASGDAYFASDNSWHTMLVVPMGAGGRSVVGLDITDASATAPSVAWEFTDPDLGYVLGQPTIQRMANGRWAAIFSSGYGIDRSAKLFVVDVETGALIRKISTLAPAAEATAAANGLSAPYPADLNGDAIVDAVYAGDLYGNIWRFDVSSTNATSWRTHHRNGAQPAPLITVCASGNVTGPFACPAAQRQPITARPVVGRSLNGSGLSVYFGTGKFYEDGDNIVGTGPVQTFYRVEDANSTNSNNDRLTGRSVLQQQSIVAEVDKDGEEYRVVTANAPATGTRGWYLDLITTPPGYVGERVVADPVLQQGRVIFTTLIPSTDACTGGATGWLMEVDASTGGRITLPVLDLDDDGNYDGDDMVDLGGNPVAPSGRKSDVGALAVPTILNIPGSPNQRKIMQGSSGQLMQQGERDAIARGRTSWRQFWP